MKRKFSITVVIFFSAFMLNVSAMAFQQRYDRREDDEDFNPYVIEMMDLNVFKYLKNTWFYDLSLTQAKTKVVTSFFIDNSGFGNACEITAKPFLTCQLKLLMIEYIGFFDKQKDEKTTYRLFESG